MPSCEFHLAATAQNLGKLAKLLPKDRKSSQHERSDVMRQSTDLLNSGSAADFQQRRAAEGRRRRGWLRERGGKETS